MFCLVGLSLRFPSDSGGGFSRSAAGAALKEVSLAAQKRH